MGFLDSPSHILIVLLVLVLLFGSAKLPRLAKSLGESMRIFKSEAKHLQEDDAPVPPAAQVQQVAQQQLPAPAPVTIQLPDGTTATGTPMAEAPRTNQPG